MAVGVAKVQLNANWFGVSVRTGSQKQTPKQFGGTHSSSHKVIHIEESRAIVTSHSSPHKRVHIEESRAIVTSHSSPHKGVHIEESKAI